MYDRILVPTDGSTGSAHVALQALDLAEQYGATVHALHVVDSSVRSRLTEAGGDGDELEQSGQRAIEMVERMAQSHSVDVVTEIREGDPAETIIDYAEEIGADAIVAGTHGRSGISRRLLGSVAERLVRHASCPVMTVRLPETDVTVESVEQARGLIEDHLTEAGYDATITDIERQLAVWVAEAEDDDHLVVYLDPVTQRTSILPQHHE
jgi:nucleotide-binding universal stress UspA family protein